jgi:hypothetical protein
MGCIRLADKEAVAAWRQCSPFHVGQKQTVLSPAGGAKLCRSSPDIDVAALSAPRRRIAQCASIWLFLQHAAAAMYNLRARRHGRTHLTTHNTHVLEHTQMCFYSQQHGST